ncbi:MAG: hypothetical protein KGL59_10220, partial [Acidobacteriota bacterium]|nr:hypothetical protein [Acidobacteriota bacterium]
MGINLDEIRRATEKYGGTYKPFFQSELPFKQADPELKEGCCLALCILLAANKFEGVIQAYGKTLDQIATGEGSTQQEVSGIMHEQRHVKKPTGKPRDAAEVFPDYADWMERLAGRYALQLDRGTYRPAGVMAGEIADYIQAKPGRYIIGLSGGEKGGHAISAANLTTQVRFFDPNCGLFFIPGDGFRKWFLTFMYASEYQVKYSNFWNAV